ncbi:MAG: hypothetical protein M0P01_10850 [Treponema sp.]|nr:hypothetical protein [Treponema sp.]
MKIQFKLTGLTRADIVRILSAVNPAKFDLFRNNPALISLPSRDSRCRT